MPGLVRGIIDDDYKDYTVPLSVAFADDKELVHRFNNNDEKAFGEVYDILFSPVYFFAKRFVGYEDAEDITADAFAKLWGSAKSFKTLQNIKNYLQVTVRNACINFNEKINTVKRNSGGVIKYIGLLEDGNSELEKINALKLQLIFSEIEKLPKQQKKIFELFYIARLKEKEIAEKMNIAKGTVHSQKQEAIKKIRIAVGAVAFLILILFGFMPVQSEIIKPLKPNTKATINFR